MEHIKTVRLRVIIPPTYSRDKQPIIRDMNGTPIVLNRTAEHCFSKFVFQNRDSLMKVKETFVVDMTLLRDERHRGRDYAFERVA